MKVRRDPSHAHPNFRLIFDKNTFCDGTFQLDCAFLIDNNPKLFCGFI